jgi:hypothetical protein
LPEDPLDESQKITTFQYTLAGEGYGAQVSPGGNGRQNAYRAAET